MKKTYSEQNFEFVTVNHGKITIYCHVYETPKTWGHEATAYRDDRIDEQIDGTRAKIVYYNRTWEAFKFESLLYKIAEILFPNKRDAADRAAMEAQIKAIADGEREAAQKWAESFAAAWGALSSEIRERTARALDGKTINTREDAENILNTAQAFDAMIALTK